MPALLKAGKAELGHAEAEIYLYRVLSKPIPRVFA